MFNRVLILGGARFHGLQLAESMAEAGKAVYVLNRGNTKREYRGNIRHLVVDRNDPSQLNTALAGLNFDVIIDNNAYFPAQVDELMKIIAGRFGHYVLISSTAVYLALFSERKIREDEADGLVKTPFSPRVRGYAINKLAAENFLRTTYPDLDYTVIRFPNIFGAGDFLGKLSYFYHRLQDGEKLLLEKEVKKFRLICAADAVKAMTAAAGNRRCFGQTVNIADPLTYDYNSFFSTIFGGIFQSEKIVLMEAEQIWEAGYFLPFAWGAEADTSLADTMLDKIDYSPMKAWAEETLKWELKVFKNRSSEAEFRKMRQLELKLIDEMNK